MAKAFERLPHTVGIITNLDGAAVNRSLVSIQSELKRRQAIFQSVSKRIGVSNIDIYKYQKLFREGTVTEPLQHLFIISDEFAELKTQQPDFMRGAGQCGPHRPEPRRPSDFGYSEAQRRGG